MKPLFIPKAVSNGRGERPFAPTSNQIPDLIKSIILGEPSIYSFRQSS
jgi:hypothetical protein